jgi:hypothetical protein
MNAMAAEHTGGVESIRYQASLVHRVVRTNVDGITHEESLRQPEPGGNCLNWVVGHLVWAYAGALPLVRQAPAVDKERLAQYARGGPPLTEPGQAMQFDELLAAWDESSRRMDRGLADLPTRWATRRRAAPPATPTRPSARCWPRSCFTRPITPARRPCCGGSSGRRERSSNGRACRLPG